MPDLRIVDHPLVLHKLSLMRAQDTPTGAFRQLMREVGLLLAYEATRDLPVEEVEIETPLERARLPRHSTKWTRVTYGRRFSSSTEKISGRSTIPWIMSRCSFGSISGMNEPRCVAK